MLYILLSKTKAATYNVMYVYPFIVVFVEECAFMRPVHVILSKNKHIFSLGYRLNTTLRGL